MWLYFQYYCLRSSLFLDNSYGKNSQFFNTWLRDMNKIKMIVR